MLEVTKILIDTRTKEVLGVQVSAGGIYSVSLTKEKAKSLGVADIDIIHLYDLPKVEVVSIRKKYFALVDNASCFIESYADTPFEDSEIKKLYWGYGFDDRYVVPLDSDTAIKRMLDEAEGKFINE